uniref:Uncharacterized protein n=1 Tax=Arundo donax TaxID=35708 RepID=A0A0A9ADY9_ARUDO
MGSTCTFDPITNKIRFPGDQASGLEGDPCSQS